MAQGADGASVPAVVPPVDVAPVRIDWTERSAFARAQDVTSSALGADPTFQLHQFLAWWAEDWGQGDADRYLEHYSESFVPSGYYEGWDRARWESARRSRLDKATQVELTVDNVVLIWPREGRRSAQTARIEFRQSYRSATFTDVVDKRLELTRAGGTWKIVREDVLRELMSEQYERVTQ